MNDSTNLALWTSIKNCSHYCKTVKDEHRSRSERTKMQGPKVTISLSCSECEHCKNESYTCQSDSGVDVYCVYPNTFDSVAGCRKRVGDSNWNTPQWCPLRKAAIDKAIAEIPPRCTAELLPLGSEPARILLVTDKFSTRANCYG
jgi:hypothetical protein